MNGKLSWPFVKPNAKMVLMRKIISIWLLLCFVLLLNLSTVAPVNAQSCCPDTGSSPYKYHYNTSTGKCVLNGPQGSVSVNSNCSTGQICNSSNQCENYQEPETPAGCSTNSSAGQFCVTTPYNYNIYCSTAAECDDYKSSLNTFYPSLNSSNKSSDNDPTCDGGKGIDTAIGCIDVLNESGPEAFLGDILKWAVGVGGGIAFLLIVYASFMIMTSSGNPERLKAGQELLTSAISGLVLLIFSVFILKFIGVDILGLDKFGFGG